MITLAIDTSQERGSVTLLAEDEAASVDFDGASHLVGLGRAATKLLGARRLEARHIDRIAVVSGPGSFTGLRIGMAYAKGLHAAVGAGIVTMTSLELLAVEGFGEAPIVCPMIDARRSEIYGALYEPGEPFEKGPWRRPACLLEPRAASPGTFLLSVDPRPVVCVGSGARRYAGEIEATLGDNARVGGPSRPSTELLSRLAAALLPHDRDGALALEPFYIRPSDAKLKPLKKVQARA
jgi:tRNA threonylcarbamoyladenosine biosynthesis protein TsaB